MRKGVFILAAFFPLVLLAKPQKITFRHHQYKVGEEFHFVIHQSTETIVEGAPLRKESSRVFFSLKVVEARGTEGVARLKIQVDHPLWKSQRRQLVLKGLERLFTSLRFVLGPGLQVKRIEGLAGVLEKFLPPEGQAFYRKVLKKQLQWLLVKLQDFLFSRRSSYLWHISGVKTVGEEKTLRFDVPSLYSSLLFLKLEKVEKVGGQKVARYSFRQVIFWGALFELLGMKTQVVEGTLWIREDGILERMESEAEWAMKVRGKILLLRSRSSLRRVFQSPKRP